MSLFSVVCVAIFRFTSFLFTCIVFHPVHSLCCEILVRTLVTTKQSVASN